MSAMQGKHTILVVDDTPQNLTVLGELLYGEFHVRVANSGENALRAVLTEPRPDLVLLDIMMPGLDGHQVLRRLKEEPSTHDIPVIFITALTGAQDEETGLQQGAVDYISKPFSPAVVIARVRTHLELKDARDRLAKENRLLDDEVARRMRDNLLVQELSIKALAILAETRDMETGHHITRTQIYVELLGKKLIENPRFAPFLAGGKLETIVKAAALHDIGKVGIPDSILLKPGRLTAQEFEIMKTHASIGAKSVEKAMTEAIRNVDHALIQQSLSAFSFMHVVRDIALTHHEKWDGTGYPEGLVGDAIPVGGRLMALADVFDALVCRRIYKAAMEVDEVAKIIWEGRATHFDPDVVDAYWSIRLDFEQVANQYRDSE